MGQDPVAPGAVHPAVPEDTLEDLYENAPCGYVSTLPGGLITRVNQTFLTWTGYRREELVRLRRFQDLLAPGGRIYYETHLAPLLQMQGAVREIAAEVVRADGGLLPMLVNAVLDRDNLGTPRGIRTVVFDATDRRAYERELLRQREAAEASEARTHVLQGLTAALAAALGPGDIAAVVATELSPYLPVDDIALALVDDDTGALVPVTDGSGGRVASAGLGDAATEAARLGTAVFTAQPSAGGAAAYRTVAVPLKVGGRVLGVLRLDFPPGPAFGADERDFLVTVARQCAQAVDRARLLAATAEAGRRATLLAQVSRTLDEVRSLGERAHRLVGTLVPDLADRAVVELTAGTDLLRIAGAPATGVLHGELLARGGKPQAVRPSEIVAAALATGEPQLVTAVGAAGTDLPLVGSDARSYVVLPLRTRGQVIGALTLVSTSRRVFRTRDLPFLADLAYRTALALDNVRVFEQERDVAHTLQQSMLAGEAPDDPRAEVSTYYRAAVEGLEVGGDWYDSFLISPDVLAVVVGDVVGRGLVAASAMGQLRSAVRALAGTGMGPAAVLRQLDSFVEHVEAAGMATVVYAEVHLVSGKMRYAAAGHLPPLAVPPEGPPELLWGGRSAPLGVSAGLPPREEDEVTLAPGTRLLLYTDGLVERRRRSVLAGLERLSGEVEARRLQPPPALVAGLAEVMLADEDRPDDVCVLCLSVDGPS